MTKPKLIVALTCATVLATAGPAAADVLPVGNWTFDEGTGTVAHDSSPYHNNGTLQNGAQWAHGGFSGGITFNGNSSDVLVNDSAAIDPASVSVSAWVNSAGSPGDFKYIVAKGANGCLAASYGLYTGANGGLEFYVSTDDGVSWTISPAAGAGIWDGQWHNVVGTFDGSTVRLYVDGRQVGSGTPDSSPIGYGLPTSNALMVGDYPGCAGLDFSGTVDAVKIWNRALDPGEIALGYGVARLWPTSAVIRPHLPSRLSL